MIALLRSSSAQGRLLAGGLFLWWGLIGCNEVTGDDEPASATLAQVIRDVPSKVIFATYTDLAAKSDSLQKAVDRLAQTPTAALLTAAQQAWRDTRVPWESGEGFLFGPVVTIPIDAVIDSWPLDQTDLQNVLASTDSLTKSYIDSLGVNLKGFHTIEYLLFGDSVVARTADNFTVRQLQYLQATTASLGGEVHALLQAWDPAGGDFLGTLERAGHGSKLYTTEHQALEELLRGLFNICDEVANEKIYNVFRYEPPDRTQEESRFSDNSTADFTNNIRSARNLYLGSYGSSSGYGLKALLLKKHPALAAKVEAEFDSAIAATLAMGNFGQSVFTARDKVEAASTAIRTLRGTLILEVGKALDVEL